LNERGNISLPPPQFYEISRLRNFADIDNLLKFASDRASYGIERYFPLRISTEDGNYTILPGTSIILSN